MDSLIVDRRSLHHSTGLEALYWLPLHLSKILVTPGSEGPPTNFLKIWPWYFSWDENFLVIFWTIDSRRLYVPWKFQKNLTARFWEIFRFRAPKKIWKKFRDIFLEMKTS